MGRRPVSPHHYVTWIPMHPDQDRTKPHPHVFGQDQRREGERLTLWVILLTVTTMAVEIVAGLWTGSMALLADGLHMGSHTIALGINALAYNYARRQANNPQFSFGTGKVNALGGFVGALLLALFSLVMAIESVERLMNPTAIAFDYAITVAVVGLLVNGASVAILGHGHTHSHSHSHELDHDHDHDHDHDEDDDHNLRSAYLHVLADALTSVLAIFALLAGKYMGLNWMDPIMGIVGAILVARWSVTLLKDTSATLLDRQAPVARRQQVTQAVETVGDARVVDLHLWSVGPGIWALELVVVASQGITATDIRARLCHQDAIVHSTIELQHLS